MIFSKRSRYGIRALIDLAQNTDHGCIQLSEIAERNNISFKYLEQIFITMRIAGLLKSVKGPQGGYYLAKDPGTLKIAEIITVLEGSYCLESEKPLRGEKGEAESLALQKEIIDPINEFMEQFLNGLTLKKLVEYCENYKEVSVDMYYI